MSNLKTLHNFEPRATDEEIRASSLQFVRELCGFTRPAKANQLAFDRAANQVAKAAHELLDLWLRTLRPAIAKSRLKRSLRGWL